MTRFQYCHLHGPKTTRPPANLKSTDVSGRATLHAFNSAAAVNSEIVKAEDPEQRRARENAKVSGTWDFKWPAGTRIRFAFQKLPDDVTTVDFAVGKSLVEAKLNAWLNGRAEKGIPVPDLSFEIVAEELPAPRYADHGKTRVANSEAGGHVVAYDVLVSFLPLPVVLPVTEQFPTEVEIGTSASELGRYAQRIDYGVPTMYLGPQVGADHARWFTSPEGIFSVVHEIGHALGFPHEQQNPKGPELPWKPEAEMVEIVNGRGGLAPSISPAQFLKEEVTGRWPGAERFSDWREPPVGPHYDFDSVMAKPSYRCLLQGVHPAQYCTPDRCTLAEEEVLKLHEPTDSDLWHLITMYGERVAAEEELQQIASERAAAQ